MCQDTDFWDGKTNHENMSVRAIAFTFEFERFSEDDIYIIIRFSKRKYFSNIKLWPLAVKLSVLNINQLHGAEFSFTNWSSIS